MSKTYYITTFGCQMNINDSEHIAGMLEFQGFKPGHDQFSADVVVLNTCAVRDKPERRAYGQAAKLNALRKKKSTDQKLYLAGCIPAYDKETILKKLPFLDGIIDVEEARQYPARRANSTEAWVAIMQGCNNYCSYCIVPYTRGREEILEEIKKIDLIKKTTLFLLGQNVNSYQGTYQKNKIDFPRLLELILEKNLGITKINFLTSHPKDMSDRLIEVIANNPQVDRELHFPIQHGNDRILGLMNRGYTYAQYKALVEKIRARIPDVKISTDIIVGFPSETEQDLLDACKAVEEIKFFKVITVIYSPRTGTKAASMPEQISEEVKLTRLQKLMQYVNQYCGQ